MKKFKHALGKIRRKVSRDSKKLQPEPTTQPISRDGLAPFDGDENVDSPAEATANRSTSSPQPQNSYQAPIAQQKAPPTSPSFSEASANSHEPETAIGGAKRSRAALAGRPALLAEEQLFSDSPRDSLETGASTVPSVAEQTQAQRRPPFATRELRTDRVDADQDADNPAVTPTIKVRSPTLPLDSGNGGTRNLLFLDTDYLVPSAAGYTSATSSPVIKSPAPSVSEGDLMEEIMPHRIDVTVTITWEECESTWVPEKMSDFLWITPKSYDDLLPHKILRKHQDAHSWLETREIYHRHGSCRVRSSSELQSETPYRILDEDSADRLSEAAIQIICDFISKNPHQPFSLEVYWDSGSAQLAPLEEEDTPFSEVIRSDMRKKKRTNFRGQSYIPLRDQNVFQQLSVVKEIVFRDNTLDKLDDSTKSHFVKMIVQKPALKLWMICVYLQKNMAFLRHLLLAHECDDSATPKKDEECLFPLCQDRMTEVLDSLSTFKVKNVEGEYNHAELPPTEVMPLRWTGTASGVYSGREELGRGASSEVYKVHIDCSHHYLSGDPWCQFALKEFHNHRREEFEREKEMLCVLADYPDPHIVLHIQSWTQEERYYILYPKAACNLRDFIREKKPVDLSKPSVLWFLRQLCGLARAIKHVHNLKHPTNTDRNPDQDALWGCHYDIKPENILVFEKRPNHHPVFKISDFGIGVFNKARAPGEESVLTREDRGSEAYFAPDLDRDGRKSRPFDMWALGCVFLELMVWLFGLFETGDGFSTRRFDSTGAGMKGKDDKFWTKDASGRHVMKSAVKEVLRHLRRNHCTKLRAFLKVIKAIHGLLLFSPKERWDAPKLASFLEDTIRQATTDLEKVPSFYKDQYEANLFPGKTVDRQLASERINPDDSSDISTRSASPSSPERQRRSLDERPRSENRSSQAVLHTGSGTEQTSDSRATAGDHSPGTHDALQRELSEISVSA